MTFVQHIIPDKIKSRNVIFFSFFLFFFFFPSELLDEMFVTVLSETGFAGDLKVLFQKLVIDH